MAGALAEINDARAVEPLVPLLDLDGLPCVQSAAAEALEKLHVPKERVAEIRACAVEPLIAAMKDGKNRERERAAKKLGEIKDARAVEALIGTLNEKYLLFHEAAWALGQIGDPRAVGPLIAALRDKNNGSRYMAAEALGQLKAPSRRRALDRGPEGKQVTGPHEGGREWDGY